METHLTSEKSNDMAQRANHFGWKVVTAPAQCNMKSKAGREASRKGVDPGKANTNGVAIGARKWLDLSETMQPSKLVRGAHSSLQQTLAKDAFVSMDPAFKIAVWRSQGASIAIVAAYFEVNEWRSGKNHATMARIAAVLKLLGLKFIVFADWNTTKDTLIKVGWHTKLSGQFIEPADVQFTCSAGLGRMLDFCW